MLDNYTNELLLFLKIADYRQLEILNEYNSFEKDSIDIYDVIPKNLDKDPKLQDFVKFLIQTKVRHDRNRDK